jgi:ribosome-binding protein aMBF1 (putative translation factor)
VTPARFQHCRQTIGWTLRGLADRLSVHETKPRRWERGVYPIPDDVAGWLERLTEAHEANPPPRERQQAA